MIVSFLLVKYRLIKKNNLKAFLDVNTFKIFVYEISNR